MTELKENARNDPKEATKKNTFGQCRFLFQARFYTGLTIMSQHKSQNEIPLWLSVIVIVFSVFLISAFGILGWYTIITDRNIDIFSFLFYATIATAALWYGGKNLIDIFKEDKNGVATTLGIIALIMGSIYVANNIQHRTPRVSEPHEYYESKGYECTNDCSGHNAGYEWAKKNDICDVSYDVGKSNSFNEGVRVYAGESC